MILKFNKVDRSILSLTLAIVIVFSFFLYDDSFLFRSRESKNSKIGSITRAENDVRLRASDSFSWNPAKPAEVVFERDSVFTGKRSQTQIDLIDGSKLFLNENSLVTLVAKNGTLELNLRYGNIKTEINPTSKLELKSGSQKIQIDKQAGTSTLEIKKPKFGLIKLKLLAGKLTVKNSGSTSNETLVVDQTLVIKPTGTIQKSKPGMIELITPNLSQFYQGNPEKGFYLDWHSQNMEKTTLYISKDKDFKSNVVTQPNVKTKVFVKELPSGIYFWKISGLDANSINIQSEVRTFSTSLLEKITIVYPAPDSKIAVETRNDIKTHKVPVKINWTNIYDWVQIQIAGTADFATPLYDKELTKTYTLENSYTAGSYFIRARGKKAMQMTDWSDVRKFDVIVSAKPLVKTAVPILLTKNLTFNTSGRTPSSVNPVMVKWQGVESAIKYEMEISLKDPKFTKPTRVDSKTTQSEYMPKSLGTHYYRVRAISSDNVPSEYSEVGELQAALSAPKLTKVERIVLKSSDPGSLPPTVQFKLNWNAVMLANQYVVEMSDSEKFNAAEKISATKNTIEVPTSKTGKYFFRVKASDSNQTVKSEPSNIQESDYAYIKRLSKPVLTEPKNKMTVFLQKEIEPFIWLNWDSTVNQKDFELEIAFDKKFARIITRKKQPENRFLIKDKLPLGKIYWRVRQMASDPDLISDWTETREFQLIHNKNEGVFK